MGASVTTGGTRDDMAKNKLTIINNSLICFEWLLSTFSSKVNKNVFAKKLHPKMVWQC